MIWKYKYIAILIIVISDRRNFVHIFTQPFAAKDREISVLYECNASASEENYLINN